MDWGIPELNNASNGIIIKTLWCVAIVCDEEVYDCQCRDMHNIVLYVFRIARIIDKGIFGARRFIKCFGNYLFTSWQETENTLPTTTKGLPKSLVTLGINKAQWHGKYELLQTKKAGKYVFPYVQHNPSKNQEFF